MNRFWVKHLSIYLHAKRSPCNEAPDLRGFFVVTSVGAFPQERHRGVSRCVPACACEA